MDGSDYLGIDHVQLAAPAGCEAAGRRFFGELLGLEEIPKPEAVRATGGVWFRVGAQELHIGIESGFAPARKAHPSLMLRDEDALLRFAERLTAAGCDIEWDNRLAGQPRFYVADPWGNRVELRCA